MKVIVFGSNGYLGKNFTYYLESNGVEVFCFDIQDKSKIKVSNYKKLDITIIEDIKSIDLSVDFIYFFSGLTGTWQGFENYEKYIDINEKGLLNLLTCLKNENSKAKIIFPSTRLVYKGQKDKLLVEDEEKEAKTIYALNKITCELLLQMYKNIFGINYTIYRICIPYGHLIEGDLSYGTIDFFVSKAKNNEQITLFGDGNLKRTFSHIEDICNQIFESSSKKETDGNIYNIGGENLSLYNVALLIAKKYSVQVDLIPWPESALKIESGDTMFDSAKLNQIIQNDNRHKLSDWLYNN